MRFSALFVLWLLLHSGPAFSLTIWQAGSTADSEQQLSVGRGFGSDMVLQAGKPLRVSGYASPGSTVEVVFAEQAGSAIADSEGCWFVELGPEIPCATPRSMIVRNKEQELVFEDILIGEVWFCAGQSNMQWPLSKSTGGAEAIESSEDDLLRLFNFKGGATGGGQVYGRAEIERLQPHSFATGCWQIANPESSTEFSAVGYYFGEALRESLDCPVGIINVSLGGTPVESWISREAMSGNDQLSGLVSGNWLENPRLDGWCKDRARHNLRDVLSGDYQMDQDLSGPAHPFKPGFMFQESVEPFEGMSLAGVLWYQGESNAESLQRIRQYEQAFPVLVNSWRELFGDPELPIGFVQLPALNREHWPVFREQQRRSLDEIVGVGMVTTMDVGNRTDVHPRDKAPIGLRLATWSLSEIYAVSDTRSAPQFESASRDGGSILVSFGDCEGSLITYGDTPLHFEVAGGDRVFHPAVAQIVDSKNVRVDCAAVPDPVHVRYAWAPYPDPPVNLFDAAGTPVGPFTTDAEYLSGPPVEYSVTKIWDQSPHNAFTDLIHWNGKFYCAFRTGTGHVPGPNGEDGKIQVIVSADGHSWSSFAHIEEAGIDLRDPKLSAMQDGRLMLLMGGSNYDGESLLDRGSRVAFLGVDEPAFTEIHPVRLPAGISTGDDWLWRVTWHRGTGYGVVYQAQESPWGLHLVKTVDGINYEPIRTLNLPGKPNETTVRFLNDSTMHLVVRNEEGGVGHSGKAVFPFTEFQWNTIPMRLGGPDHVYLDDGRCLLGTRKYGDPATTVIGWLNEDGRFDEVCEFPSAGDTSYPRLLVHGRELLVSYYSSHEGRTSIYLARIQLSDLSP